jgi:molybdate transport system substrate-binding protein
MRSFASLRLTIALAVIWFMLTASLPAAADSGRIVVFAAASLREAFEAAAPAFTKKSGIAVTYNFGGSDTLAGQIAQGAPADAFASANESQMKRVVDAGLAGDIASPADLAKPGVKIVLAAATVPIGGYARIAFAKLASQDGYPADCAAAVERNIVSDELDVKAIATKVALGEADAGVVYASDVTPQLSPKFKEIAFPAGAAPEARYPIVAIKNAANTSGAQAFVDFVLGEGQSYLRARGFLAP